MISVTIIVKNAERCIYEVLTSVQQFPEVILFDTGSIDQTLSIAKKFSNVRIYQEEFRGFGNAHNRASALASHEWILSIDGDEVLTPALSQEILSLTLDPQTVYFLPFKNYFHGKWIRWCGWHPESHARLYHRKKSAFSEALIHEGVITRGLKKISLKNPVLHYSYTSIEDFLTKMQRYSTLFAEQYRHKKHSSPFKAIVHGSFAFFKSFFIKRGFLGGYEGFVISMYNAHTAYYKYLKLYEANKKNPL